MKNKTRSGSPHKLNCLLRLPNKRKPKTFRRAAESNLLTSNSQKITKKETQTATIRERIRKNLLKKGDDEINELLSKLKIFLKFFFQDLFQEQKRGKEQESSEKFKRFANLYNSELEKIERNKSLRLISPSTFDIKIPNSPLKEKKLLRNYSDRHLSERRGNSQFSKFGFRNKKMPYNLKGYYYIAPKRNRVQGYRDFLKMVDKHTISTKSKRKFVIRTKSKERLNSSKILPEAASNLQKLIDSCSFLTGRGKNSGRKNQGKIFKKKKKRKKNIFFGFDEKKTKQQLKKLGKNTEKMEVEVMICIIKGKDSLKIKHLFEDKPWLLSAQDSRGRTCLHYAALFQDFDLCKFLIKQLVLNKRDKIGLTAYELWKRNFRENDAGKNFEAIGKSLKWYDEFKGVDE